MKIIVYSTQNCYFCTLLKNFLKENKIEFKEVDVGKDREAAKKIIEQTKQMGVPITEIDGRFIIGFDKEKLKKLLKL